MAMGKKLEICLNSDNETHLTDNVKNAFIAGASRIELCSSMHQDGLTPSDSAISNCAKIIPNNGELLIMIRPIANDFSVDAPLLKKMLNQIEKAAELGANGVVFGAIKEAEIDVAATRILASTAQKNNLKTTFHRAFDCIAEPLNAIPTLIDLGIDRVLTNGAHYNDEQNILHGIESLRRIIKRANNQIEVVIGGGVNPQNAAELWPICEGKLSSLHAYSAVLNDQGRVMPQYISQLLNPSFEQLTYD
ncbi:hypothetical protein B5G52_04365 [Pseudoalteromonas sp. A601]|nr:hypothetical protein B5G52_04365 [Pseudoalteromonas sp. A601]